jgi:Outer membrane protein beta-barrel domain
MRQSLTVIPLALLVSFVASHPLLAANRAGDMGFSTSIGIADARSDSAFRSDQTINFSLEYQKTGYAAYRGTAGFLTVNGREEISPGAGTRDMDAMFVTGNLVVAPRFAMVHPFFTVGLGFYSERLTDRRGSDQNIELGLNWGLGIDVELVRHFSVRGEAIFHYTTGEVANPIQTLTAGGRFVF